MDYIGQNIDELIYKRGIAREHKQWAVSDAIRNYLDTQLVFIIDQPWGQQGYYLTEKYFINNQDGITNREYLEQKIKKETQSEKNFNGWLFTNKKSFRKERI